MDSNDPNCPEITIKRDLEAFMNMKDDGDEEEGQFAKKRF